MEDPPRLVKETHASSNGYAQSQRKPSALHTIVEASIVNMEADTATSNCYIHSHQFGNRVSSRVRHDNITLFVGRIARQPSKICEPICAPQLQIALLTPTL